MLVNGIEIMFLPVIGLELGLELEAVLRWALLADVKADERCKGL
jgi:hypothetical protein